MAMSAMASLFSSSSPKAEETDVDNKRSIGDTSFLDSSNNREVKRPAPDFDFDIIGSSEGTFEQSIVKMMEHMFHSLSEKIDSSNKSILERFDRFDTRMSEIEERISSQQLAVDNIDDRITDIESKLETINSVNLNHSNEPEWEPSGTPSTNILLLGDSNSGGKIKFGSGKGTLGAALPGKETFTAKVDLLPEPEPSLLNDVSDLVLAVGTNNLKEDNCVPADLARITYSYVKKVSTVNPTTHIYLPGVLPTKSVDSNGRIKEYNHYLKDMCSDLSRVHFIDNNNFLSKNGLLIDKFSADNLHLNQDGLKIYFSRIKYALRERHGLPNRFRVRRPREETANPSNRDRGGQRGGRGGRGRNT